MDDKVQKSYLSILTLNCQGLGDINKRRDIFKVLKSKRYNIYFLQDTHFVEKEESMIKGLWGYKAYFNSYKSNSRGVAILINNNCDITVLNEHKDDDGNFLLLDVTIDSLSFLLINIYGPNVDSPAFYINLLNMIQDIYSKQHIVIGGDFNLVFDKDLDSMNYKNLNNPKSRLEVLKIMDTLSLKDVFREHNPTLKKFTWRKKNQLNRLDLISF